MFFVFRLTADTLKSLQGGQRIVPRQRFESNIPTISRRQGEFDDYEYDDHMETYDYNGFNDYDYDGLGEPEVQQGGLREKPPDKSKVNAIAVLGMIKNLQDEIQVIYIYSFYSLLAQK